MLLRQDGKLALEDPIEKYLPGYLAKRLAAMAIGDPFPSPVAVKVDPKVLAGHVGAYEIDKSTRRTVTVENGKLYTQRSGQQRLEAIPSSETEFFYENSLTRMRFERDASWRRGSSSPSRGRATT
jgi:CubicO group peptidase (beta-lactamase class C family)